VKRAIIIGSGPAAAGVALALSEEGGIEILVLDLGNTLEADRIVRRDRLADSVPSAWLPEDIAEISQRATATKGQALPQKRSFGSSFPFENVSQLDGISAVEDANSDVVSGAYGGFSNVWGSQVMPFSESTFDDWPCSFSEMQPHYRRILEEVPLAGEHDGLSELFPLIHATSTLPKGAERTTLVLERAKRHRTYLQRRGVTLGAARLAFRAQSCVCCGLCMTGCPYQLIYSASQTFDRLRREKKIKYRGGLLVTRISQSEAKCEALARDIHTGELVKFQADRIFVACGGIGTTRLVLGSLPFSPRRLELLESVQFGLPFVSSRGTQDPRDQSTYTLNQFNMVIDLTGYGKDLVQIHCYPYNPALTDSLPAPIRAKLLEPVHRSILKRVTVGLGYIPSWASPKIVIQQEPRRFELPTIKVSGDGNDELPMLRRALAKLRTIAPLIDLWPVAAKSFVSGAGKSYHFGGSFPHSPSSKPFTTDRTGRLAAWDRIHLTDASTFPSVPATTFTLTIMANAHRIAKESLRA